MGIVAHYYMDVELQGVLTAVQKEQQLTSNKTNPMVAIADSLAMGDFAVKMCEEERVWTYPRLPSGCQPYRMFLGRIG